MSILLRSLTLQAIYAATNPEKFFAKIQQSEGDPFKLKFPIGKETLFTGTPEGAKELFDAPAKTFDPTLPNPVSPLLGENSLILLKGERHKQEKELLMPLFHGGMMRSYGGSIREIVNEEIDQWRSKGCLTLAPSMQTITLRVIIRAVIGVTNKEREKTVILKVSRFLAAYTAPLMLLPWMRKQAWNYGPWAEFQKAKKALDALLNQEIELARKAGGSTDDGGSLLSKLVFMRLPEGIGLSEAEISDQLRTLLVAGHETTATALVWALYYLHKYPRVLERLVRELSSLGASFNLDEIEELPYLEAVCNEALRIHPVVPIILRSLNEDFTFRGAFAKKGTNIGIATTLLHSEPRIWPDAKEFTPERFLGKSYLPYEFAPFGGGARRCLGANFAIYEMKVVLALVIGQLDMRLIDPGKRARPVLRNITMGPNIALKAKVKSKIAKG